MDQGGSMSKAPEDLEHRKRAPPPIVDASKKRKEDDTPALDKDGNPIPTINKQFQTPPVDEAEEDERAAEAGSKHFPTPLWNRLKDPPKDRPPVDVWEFKMDGEILTMTFTCDGEKYPMYFTPRSTIDYTMRSNCWVPRHDMLWASLRTRIYSVPKWTKFNRIVFHNTPDSEAEDCLLEFMYIKRWSAKQIDYTICMEWTQPHHLRRLCHMFKPSDIIIHLAFGPYPTSSLQNETGHMHLAAAFDSTVELEKDFRSACAAALNGENKTQVSTLYSEAGRGKAFGLQMLRTLGSLRMFVGLMLDRQMAQIKGMNVRKFVVNGPSSDRPCSRMMALLKDEGVEESNRKRAAYANGDKVFVCVRNEMRRVYKYSLAQPASSFKMQIGNEQLLAFTKTVPYFHCLFRTSVDEKGVVQLVTEWYNNQRHFDEIQLHLDKVIDGTFLDHLVPDMSEPKRIKLKRNHIYQGHKHTLLIEKERLGSRHLHIRVVEWKP